jgi:adenylate kinase family enzyme
MNTFNPDLSIKVAFIGKPFSGKEEAALEISKRYQAPILRSDALVKNAIEAYEAKVDSTIAQIGKGIHAIISSGDGISDQLMVDLISASINQLNRQAKESASDGSAEASWILVDFPRTKMQAQLLEMALTG